MAAIINASSCQERYFARGECRSGKDCKFSHDPEDIPICRYFMEDRCHFGADCWFRHPKEEHQPHDLLDMTPISAVMGSKIVSALNPNMNLLLAATIAGFPTPIQETQRETDSDEDKEKEEITLEKVLEMWKELETKRDENNNESSDKSVDKDPLDFENKNDLLASFFNMLNEYSIKSWGPNDVYQLVTTLVDLDVKDFDEFDFITSKILGNTLSLWKPDSLLFAELIMMIVQEKEADMASIILTICNSPTTVKSLEKHLATTIIQAEKKDPSKWDTKAVGHLLQLIEENGFNVDAIEFFHNVGKEIKDAEKLGELVHDYLVATGDKDTFQCTCKTAECECPVIADEGVAFIMFAGLQRKLEWNDEDKVKFFQKATYLLWKPELLTELGDIFGVKEPLKVATPIVVKKKVKAITQETSKKQQPQTSKNDKASKKCQGKLCNNSKKKDCDNMMCGRCCKRSGKTCIAHEDPLDVYYPPQYHASHRFHKMEPSVFFTNKLTFEEKTTNISDEKVCHVGFDSYFSIMDSELIKVVDLWGENLLVLTLGSSDSGCGSQLTDASILHLAEKCPNLCKLQLDSATGVTDKAMAEIIEKCVHLEELDVTGNDKISGKLTDTSLKKLFDEGLLPKLQQLCVTDQMGINRDVVYRLRRRRPNMKVIAGETDSDSFAHSMVLSMMGLDYGDGLY